MIFTPYYSSSRGNLYTVSEGDSTLLIEAGVPIKKIYESLNYRLSSVDACFISHAHKDHSRAVKDLVARGVDCWMSVETAVQCGVMDLTGAWTFSSDSCERVHIGNWVVAPFPTEHDCPGSRGFLIGRGKERLLFLTDSYFCRYRFRGLTHIAIECNYSKETLSPDLEPYRRKRLLTSHFSLENVGKFLQANDLSTVEEIHLIHLSDENSDAEMFQRRIEELTGKPTYVAPKGQI